MQYYLLREGDDKEALEALDLGPLDETIELSRPHIHNLVRT